MAKKREFRLLSSIPAILILLMIIFISKAGAVVPSSTSLFDDPNGDAALQAMEGVWHGVPTFAVPGPLTSPSGFNMTVAPVGNTSVTKMWLLSDVFAGYLINGSYQQFWANQRAGTLEYCVAVVNWLYGEPAMFAVPFVTTGSTGPSSSSRGRSSRSLKGRSIWWSAVNQTYTAIWTLTIVDEEGNQLHSELLMDGAKHLEVTYTRVVGGDVNKSGGDKKKKKIINQDTTTSERIHQYLPEETETKMKEVEQMVATAAAAAAEITIGGGSSSLTTTSNGLPPICHQISLPPNSEKPVLGLLEGKERENKNNNLEPEDTHSSLMEKRSRCPYGFSSGQIPKFVEDQLAARKKSKNPGKGNHYLNNNNNNSSKTQQHQHDDDYHYCYWINPAMNLKVRWTINNATQAIDVLVSATKEGLGSQSNQYLAIGIKPNWPLMQGMDIALGFTEPVLGRGCVQSLYAEVNLGSPEKNPSQVLYNTSSWITTTTQDDVGPEKGATTGSVVEETLWVQFSRPFNTGHHNLLNTSDFPQAVGPMIAFAQGPVYQPPREEPLSSSLLEKNLTHICDSSIAGYHGYQRGVYGFEWLRPEWALNDYMRCDRN